MRPETKERLDKAQAKIDSGVSVKEATKSTGWTESAYYAARRNSLPAKITRKYKRTNQVSVIDLPTTHVEHGKTYMIFGTAKQLAEFVRGLS